MKLIQFETGKGKFVMLKTNSDFLSDGNLNVTVHKNTKILDIDGFEILFNKSVSEFNNHDFSSILDKYQNTHFKDYQDSYSDADVDEDFDEDFDGDIGYSNGIQSLMSLLPKTQNFDFSKVVILRKKI